MYIVLKMFYNRYFTLNQLQRRCSQYRDIYLVPLSYDRLLLLFGHVSVCFNGQSGEDESRKVHVDIIDYHTLLNGAGLAHG